MKLKFIKKNESVPTPKYETDGAACFDLTAISATYESDNNYYNYDTGIAVEIPEGYVGLLFPRSSNSKKDLILANCVGVVDSDYRGWISFRYKPLPRDSFAFLFNKYKVGDRIGQMMIIPVPKIELEEVTQLSETKRGNGGYGSTGS